MYSFNTFADSFILLQSTDLSVPITHILIGHILMAFVVEFGFRSYLQNIVETKMNTFFASIVVGLIYSVFSANTTYGTEFAAYNFLYTFSFSMILGELIRATKGRTIYIATTFHASMTFGLVFLFSEEIGDLFSIKVIAISTAIVAVAYIGLSLIIRGIAYLTTKRSLDEVEPNNYLDHVNDDSESEDAKDDKATTQDHKAATAGAVTATTAGIAKHDNVTTSDEEANVHQENNPTSEVDQSENQSVATQDAERVIVPEATESTDQDPNIQTEVDTNNANDDKINH